MANSRKPHQRPEMKLAEFLSQKAMPTSYDKKVVTLKAVDTPVTGEGTILIPTEEQMAKINKFTLSTKTVDDVRVIPTLACNDMVDRDEDIFETETVKQFATLKEPFSPIGKSFMVGHDYTKLPVGRIFDATTEQIEDVTFLKVYSYIPNTDANKSYIENLDFGVYWAVSVGILFEAAQCTIGEPHPWSGWPWWCSEGHDKGLQYDPTSEEQDAWGYPIPVADEKFPTCYRMFKGAKDFYELSQVYLGAQYFAELTDKDPAMRGLVKVASKGAVPLLGLTKTESEMLPLDVDPRLEKVLRNNTAEVNEDGSIQWDDDGLRYVYEAGEITCLGRLAKEADDGEDDEGGSGNGEGEAGDEEDKQKREDKQDGVEGDIGEEGTEEGEKVETPEEPVSSATEEDMDAEQIAAIARKQGISTEVLAAAANRVGVTPFEALLQQIAEDRKDLEGKAVLGTKYLEELRRDAIDWYCKARKTKENGSVSTDNFEKLLDRCGDDVDLIKSLRDEQMDLARARFPGAVRRSTFEVDHNKIEGPEDPDLVIDEEKVKRFHRN